MTIEGFSIIGMCSYGKIHSNGGRDDMNNKPVFIEQNATFELEDADLCNNLYFPLAGESGLKSCVTPLLSGDSKLDQNHFLLEPQSIENLNNNRLTRNFWCVMDGKTVWSASGNSALQNAERLSGEKEKCKVTAGFMWHRVERENERAGIKSSILSFIPYDKNVEIHVVTLTNTGADKELDIIPSFPIYGRSADNIRDHRHVTSLLSRTKVTDKGMIDHPTFSFDERGHRLCDAFYFAEGYMEGGELPIEFYPVLDDFIGSGTPDWPESVVNKDKAVAFHPGDSVNGQEIAGAFRFKTVKLKSQTSLRYVVYAGISSDEEEYEKVREEIDTLNKVEILFEKTKKYWLEKINIKIATGDPYFDNFMRWVAFQPELRRIFGCSFLPHHDYGKGGRGWRDLWQDCLALLLMDPSGVRRMLLGNYLGTRIDGTNATIIGSGVGEFKADRNSITRVWMDHGVWPLITTALYIGQTGDADILMEECGYFCDRQIFRGRKMSDRPESEGTCQKDENGALYKGTVLEHILVQNLTAFWEVGEHNICRLRDADWNDALDMAGERGESVAFACAYAGNLETIADILDSGVLPERKIRILGALELLLEDDDRIYDDVAAKKELLDAYLEKVAKDLPDHKSEIDVKELSSNLRSKASWLRNHIASSEWIEEGEDGWFNGYYDNNGRTLDLSVPGKKNMTLTGQVFSVMNGIATDERVKKICASADRRLFDEKCGGYRLNTDFGEVKTDMGRMFGFAFGEKENGAVFSHMAVMYANALYKRGFAKEGFKALNALYKASADFETSQIYPGIPEYFGRGGKGLYSYLTGAASWYLMTVVMNMFGVGGEYGDLVVSPNLLKDQFDENGLASIRLEFAGKPVKIDIINKKALDPGEYTIASCLTDGVEKAENKGERSIRIPEDEIASWNSTVRHHIEITLE